MANHPNLFLVAAIAMCLAFPQASAADKVAKVPVQFAKGASSAVQKGSIVGYGTAEYSLSARAGQVMSVRISGSSNANFNVFPPGELPGQGTAIGSGFVGGDWSQALPSTGRYIIQVFQPRASARRGEAAAYALSIEIRGAATKAPARPRSP